MPQNRNVIEFPQDAKHRMDMAVSLFKTGDYSLAVPKLISLVDDGCVEVYSFLGNIYERGNSDIKKELGKAYFYYQQAADNGDVEGYLGLGRIYYYGGEHGDGIEKNHDEAFLCYSKLENVGYTPPVVSLMLGRMYQTGRGVELDLVKAKQYYKAASAEGNVFALNHLGGLEIMNGNFLKGVLIRTKAALRAFFIRKRNAGDSRLQSS